VTLKKLILVFAAVSLVWTAAASAHARVSPAVSVSGQLQLYSLAVPTEKEGATTTKIVLTTPQGFDIDSFAPSPGWKRTTSGKAVTWSGGSTPTEEDSLFQFLAQPSAPGTYTFQVQQTYADGSIVNWNGNETADDPAPVIEVKSSLGGGGGTSTLSIVALVLGALGVLVGVVALLAKGGRELA
jgi:uncharacterized protein YcnI